MTGPWGIRRVVLNNTSLCVMWALLLDHWFQLSHACCQVFHSSRQQSRLHSGLFAELIRCHCVWPFTNRMFRLRRLGQIQHCQHCQSRSCLRLTQHAQDGQCQGIVTSGVKWVQSNFTFLLGLVRFRGLLNQPCFIKKSNPWPSKFAFKIVIMKSTLRIWKQFRQHFGLQIFPVGTNSI